MKLLEFLNKYGSYILSAEKCDGNLVSVDLDRDDYETAWLDADNDYELIALEDKEERLTYV